MSGAQRGARSGLVLGMELFDPHAQRLVRDAKLVGDVLDWPARRHDELHRLGSKLRGERALGLFLIVRQLVQLPRSPNRVQEQ